MAQYKTPGVYTVEKNAFPNSVGAVATAIPVFIGYTENASKGGKSLKNKPQMINSFKEYAEYFGEGPTIKYSIEAAAETDAGVCNVDGVNFKLVPSAAAADNKGWSLYFLYNSVRMFYANGGGTAYVVSVGKHGQEIKKQELLDGIAELLLIDDPKPTMIVIPDACLLGTKEECYDVQVQMLAQSGKLMDRVSILDIYDGYKSRKESDVIKDFRGGILLSNLKYAAAYYPWLETSLYGLTDVNYKNINNLDKLPALFPANPFFQTMLDAIATADPEQIDQADASGKMNNAGYKAILKLIAISANVLPPSGAMAGIYTAVDKADGVWQAPANIGVAAVVRPTVFVTDDDQEDMNVDVVAGKSVNVIRSFPGRGSAIVWGARTLDGNSQDWRYINVRRTLIMIEQSIKNAAFSVVFEPNVSTTWSTVKSMIDNFLTNIWMQGGLMGASPSDAFNVSVGLGTTMTANDILDGYMRITVLLAMVRPAEFIEITYQQQMPKS
jgi:uncharacterized protein